MAKTKGGPPKNQQDFSSNWKKLQATLEPSKKRKAEDSGQEAKRRKVDRKGAEAHKPAATSANGLHGAKKADTKPTPPADKNEIWFDDVDEMLLERPASSGKQGDNSSLMMDNPVTHVTKALSMDCEMVGVGKDGVESVLARVSLVNQHGHPVYDKFVKPREKVTDYRTHVSGVRPHNLRQGEDFLVVQREVSDLLKDRLLVGHALHNDLKVLFLAHPRSQMRDTSRYKPFRQLFGGRNPSLKKLTAKLLGVTVQQGEHSSVQDAQAAMRLYMMYRRRWEKDVAAKHKGTKKKKTAASKKDKTTKKAESAKTVTFADVDE